MEVRTLEEWYKDENTYGGDEYVRCKDLLKYILDHPNFKNKGDYHEVISDIILATNSGMSNCFSKKKLRR